MSYDNGAVGMASVANKPSKVLSDSSVESIIRNLDMIRGKACDCLNKIYAIDGALYGSPPQPTSDGRVNMPASPGMMGSAAEYCRNINEKLDELYDTISRLSNNLGGPF